MRVFDKLLALLTPRPRPPAGDTSATELEELRSAFQLNQALLSNATEGIVLYDTELRYCSWNRFME